MTIDGINKETGEVVKPYETKEHNDFGRVMLRQTSFIHNNVRKEDGTELLSGKNGDALVEIMLILVGFYEELGRWLADERLHLADMKTSLEIEFAQEYIKQKQLKSETNETARMKAKIFCQESQEAVDKARHTWDRVENWKKYIGRSHDSVRSQLGWEKSLAHMTR